MKHYKDYTEAEVKQEILDLYNGLKYRDISFTEINYTMNVIAFLKLKIELGDCKAEEWNLEDKDKVEEWSADSTTGEDDDVELEKLDY
jgi:hypothetical protein